MNRILAMSLGLVAITLSFAHALPESPGYSATVIPGIPGPEDFVVDNTAKRLYISADQRLDPDGTGNIYELEVGKTAPSVMKRFNEPDSLSFRPHGVALSESADGERILWVITHRRKGEGPAHGIISYTIAEDGLYFNYILEDPLLVSPNDLYVMGDGRIYVSNDGSGKGGFAETAFSLKRSSVVMFDGTGRWSVVADKLSFANGIYARGDTLYVAATRQNAVYSYDIAPDGSLSNRSRLAKVKGPDNIMPYGDRILVAAHTRTLALVRHMSNQKNPSPSVVYAIDPDTGNTEVVFADDGRLISAASTAAFAGGNLYVGQIVGPTFLALQPE